MEQYDGMVNMMGEKQPDMLTNGDNHNISKWQDRISKAKSHYDPVFRRMREDMMYARQGADNMWVQSQKYTVPIITRYMNQAVAVLYAKNPTASAEPRRRLDFALWDGDPQTEFQAQQAIELFKQQQVLEQQTQAEGGLPIPPQIPPEIIQAQELLADIEQGRQQLMMLKRVGKTLEILFDYYANEQKPRLQPLMKQVVRRAKTCGVGYVMLGFQREYGSMSPDDTARIEDARMRLAALEQRTKQVVRDDGQDDEVVREELENLIRTIQEDGQPLLREGPVFMAPPATSIIVDPACHHLIGFRGARWICREYEKSREEIEMIYGVDIGSEGGENSSDETRKPDQIMVSSEVDERKVLVWEVYDKELGQTFTMADGHKEYLIPPKAPDYWIEGFWPIFAITFNDVESEDHLFPLSDVHHLISVQKEYNSARQQRSLHRESNRPRYVVRKGSLEQNELEIFGNMDSNAIVQLNVDPEVPDINHQIQRFQPVGFDHAVYETDTEMADVLRTVGAQEANLGGVGGGTATESSIAESSRQTHLASNVNDLDQFLTDIVEATGQLMLMELSQETVMEIVGPGAVWPQYNREMVAKQLALKIEAGSSGKPNRAAEVANWERLFPLVSQVPGINFVTLVKKMAELLEIDVEMLLAEGQPSIVAANSLAGKPPPAGDDPQAQGGQGGDNEQVPTERREGPQPEYTQPGPV